MYKHIKTGLVLIFSVLGTSIAHAKEITSKSELIPLVESIMEKVSSGKFEEGIGILKPYMTVPEEQIEGYILQTRSNIKQIVERIGPSFGYEFLGRKDVGTSLVRFVYMEKAEKAPATWTFIFYKNQKGWVSPSFKYEVDSELPFMHEHDKQ